MSPASHASNASALSRLTAGGFSIGVEAPLDNDWTPAGEVARRNSGRLPGEPDMQRHAALAKLVDQLGFRALWVRDVPVYDPSFGDAAQVFEVFTYLGYLAGITQDILLGTAAVVLPIREPLLTLKAAATVQQLSGNRLLMGVASGDRPVEYPLFGRDFPGRGANFRNQVDLLRDHARAHLPEPLDLLPARPRRCRCWWPGCRSKPLPGSASTWMAAWPSPAHRQSMPIAWPRGARWPVPNPMPASSTWSWTRAPTRP